MVIQETTELIDKAEEALEAAFKKVDQTAFANQRRVLNAFRHNRLSEEYFAEKTGYGRHDAAREKVDEIFATVFQAEAAAVRMQLVSGTHALACALLGNLKPGERLACLTGNPYDTLEEVIGISGDEPGSLKSLGVDYIQADIGDCLDEPQAMQSAISAAVQPPTTMVYLQKSCGYTFGQRALSNDSISLIARMVKAANPSCTILVDNCYGEFVEDREPTAAGADLVAGSLIKNPGGGLALTGGYIAGKAQLVESALNRLTSPGIGGHMGLTFNQNRLILQGLFLAPSVVSQAVKGAMLCAYVLRQLGLQVAPGPFDPRYDIIQGIKLGTPDRLVSFCRAIQRFSPVNSHVVPEPAEMPGYQDAVVMAGGTFIEGATIELSADGPLRPPYAAFLQGGLSYLHVKCALEGALTLCSSGELPFLSG